MRDGEKEAGGESESANERRKMAPLLVKLPPLQVRIGFLSIGSLSMVTCDLVRCVIFLSLFIGSYLF